MKNMLYDIRISVSPSQLDRLDAYRKKEKITRSRAVREIIDEFFNTSERIGMNIKNEVDGDAGNK
jgi:metal-responsive CopG/Arc/MetJ family transcriptional regulator